MVMRTFKLKNTKKDSIGRKPQINNFNKIQQKMTSILKDGNGDLREFEDQRNELAPQQQEDAKPKEENQMQ